MATRLPLRAASVAAETSAPRRPTRISRFSRYGCEKMSVRSRSASFHAAALPSNDPLVSAAVNCAGSTMVVVVLMPIRSRPASTRSSAKRGGPGALVDGVQAVDTSGSEVVCASRETAATHARTVAHNQPPPGRPPSNLFISLLRSLLGRAAARQLIRHPLEPDQLPASAI